MNLSKNTLSFANERRKLCNSFDSCEECPLYPLDTCVIGDETKTPLDDKQVLQVIQHWSDGHPRTYLQDFLTKFPDAVMDDYPLPSICRRLLYITPECKSTCNLCWNEPMEAHNG